MSLRAPTTTLGLALAASLLPLAGVASAAAGGAIDAPPALPARFAIILGVNESVDKDARPLRYADDDAAAYLELFRALGARTYLLSRFDESTRRLHPQAAAEAQDPRRSELGRVVDQVSADVALARARKVPTVVYFVYAGHGSVDSGRGYVALEDARLFGGDLEQLIVDRIGGAETHFIVDACYSVFLTLSRGPGGERREAHGFATLGGLGARPGVGLLLSTSSARESHEWSEFQAGVFSHEVRSGLLGAADANGDGQVTYREIAAFVDRANASIPNDRFRPDVYAKEPSSTPTLVDLRPGLGRRLELDGDHPGRYFIEDARGVRLADFHNAPGQPLHLLRPAGRGPLYLRKLAEETGADLDYVMDAAPAVLRFGDLHLEPSTAQPRGAAQESFRLLFSLPFSQQVVDAFVERRPAVASRSVRDGSTGHWPRRPIAFGLLVVGAAAAAGGTWAVFSALDAEHQPATTQAQAFQANRLVDQRNDWARLLYGVSGATVSAGVVLLLLPRLAGSPQSPVTIGLIPGTDGGIALDWLGRF